MVDIVLGEWFAPTDHIDAVADVQDGEDVGDTHRIGYRFEVSNGSGPPQVVEQQVYYREEGESLAYLRVVCSGYRPRPD